MENNVTQRFREFMESTGLSILAFANAIGVPQSTLNQQLNGRNGKNIGVQISVITAVLATYPDLSAEWLLRGEGSMEKGAKAVQMQFGNVLNNEDIKEMLTLAGITRIVTFLDPKTRQEVKRPINEVASSHMARRTFIGNLYKKVKDPNLVGKLSGHKENSRAFARYRDIDEDIAKELVDMLE